MSSAFDFAFLGDEEARRKFRSALPFRYVIVEDFLSASHANAIYEEFPSPSADSWIDASGAHSKNKWTQPSIDGSEALGFYNSVHSQEFLHSLSEFTGIDDLRPDPSLSGAGLHVTKEGGYLDLHVDFNRHPQSRMHRRLNMIVFLCKAWPEDGSGYLELWDVASNRCIEEIAPKFNRAVIFETNDVSFHGHPKPWRSPAGEMRKSLSVYYYTELPLDEADPEVHSTKYVLPRGWRGIWRTGTRLLLHVISLKPLFRRLRLDRVARKSE